MALGLDRHAIVAALDELVDRLVARSAAVQPCSRESSGEQRSPCNMTALR